MEPEVIRMYSSSPPPLDSVADDDDEDEFGEFGDFSSVNNSGLGFADFDSVGYPKSREDFIPPNHFMPIHEYSDNVNNFSSLTSIADAEIVSEITTSKKGPCRVLETNASIEDTPRNIATLDKKGSSGENETEADLYANSEGGFSSVGHTELNCMKDERTAGTCNGEKPHCPENLTNGFAAGDSVDPQGIEDLDNVNDSKGFKAFSNLRTDPSMDFIPSPEEEFADFSTFSKSDSIHVDDSDLPAHRDLHEGQAVNIEGSSPLDRVVDDSDSIEHDEASELDDTICTSGVDTTAGDSVALHTMAAFSPSINTPATAVSQLTDTETAAGDYKETIQNEEEAFKTTNVAGITVDNSYMVGIIQKPSQNCISDDGYSKGSLPNVSKHTISNENLSSAEDGVCQQIDSSRSQPLSSIASSAPHENACKEQSEFYSNTTEFDDFGGFEEVNTVAVEEGIKEQSTERPTVQEAKYSEFESPDDTESFEFGDFNSMARNDPGSFPESDDFAGFSSAGNVDQPGGWKAFEDDQTEGSTWTAFEQDDTEQSHRTNVPSRDQAINTQRGVTPVFHESESTLISDGSTSGSQSLLSRLERVIQVCFPPPPVSETEENVLSLNHLLTDKLEETTKSTSSSREVLDMWPHLQDIHDAYGLKHQWGGSHSNKKLLCSLGIDTRNILFTGNKKQPVIVPMYAAGLGMLEPTKEPLKPLSAAEKIASIGQSSPVHPADSLCTSDQLQDSLPPVQFDWSSSGLTNPLDGVDPELYALTTSKVESSAASSRVTDAFARLMSTAETTSTSTRKPKREENLSDEAAKVIASLPDLSFMHAKVLMFPATLMPSMGSQEKVD
uniref:Aftiphilin n=1 Tax=Leptobrachium leishanense TaxID=445787 RepID=A0A8C5MLP5_9ANUR